MKALMACVCLICLVLTASWAAPRVMMLDDFEGELVGWPKGAVLSDDAAEGAKSLRWQFGAHTRPQVVYLRFGDRGVEMAEWDRLSFDYKFEAKGANWWGVKIIDFPLAEGMQATWKVASAADIEPGVWKTATVDIQHPTWLWGSGPDKKTQRIDFRCQLTEPEAVTVLIDNVRIVRDAFRIQSIEKGESVREGDVVSIAYKLTLSNALDESVEIEMGARDASEALEVTLPDDRIVIPSGENRPVAVKLSAQSGPDGLPPLTRLDTELFARVIDMDDTEKTATLRLAIPFADASHPCLLITREQAAEVLRKIENSEDARAIYDGIKRGADAWLEKTPEYPDRGGQWWHWYTCKDCGARLRTKSPTEHVCPDCGKVYSGWPWDDVILDRQHSALGRAIRDLGLMYVLTDESAYAAKAREILMGYADRYLGYPLHDIHGEPKRGGGHVGPQSLDESTWLIPVAQGFDCIYDTLSEEDIEHIAEKMLLPAARLIHDHQWGIHNICCWHDSAYGLVGIALGDQQLAADSINGPKGFRAQVEKGVTDDGFWYESAWGYHSYTMMALQPLAIAARNIGIDLYTDRYKGMYDAPLEFMGPGGVLPAFNDSGTANALGGGSRYEIAYARWKDPRFLLPIQRAGGKSMETLLFGIELQESELQTLESTVFPAAGYVILRSGKTGGGKATRYIPENYLALDYGPHGGGHGHPDKLGFVLYGKGALLAEDPGCIAYGNPAHSGWFRQTVSHNTVVIEGKSQEPSEGALQFAAFGSGIGLCSARADTAYPGVRLRRTLALIGDRVIDIFLCESEDEVTIDWVYHNRGDLETSLALTEMPDAPEGDGYDWAKGWNSAEGAGPWQAVWRQDDGPGVALAQAAAEGDREILSAIGIGNPTRIKPPFVVSRRRAKTALYCTALDIFEGDPPPDLAVRVLAIDGATDGPEKPVAVEVTGGGRRDILLVNPGGGDLKAEQYALSGQGAVLHYEGERLAELLLVGEAEVRIRGEIATTD